ncbi:discoidin domain-containing protein [Herbidospora mongoliensis]|uniref:discoidin domain-containing protein n=1 Tax=Herbidospora mongoliensis TaxID=688067 RepID=UPI000AEBA364|nr:discoidin domain-containing protein [Herbidospora mongoliensis]
MIRTRGLAIVTALAVLAALSTATSAQAATPTADQQWTAVQSLVGAVKGRWTNQAYTGSVTDTMPDTAIIGNGDIGVTSGGGEGFKTFRIAKGDFWTASPNRSLVALGSVSINPVSNSGSPNLAIGSTATASSSHSSFPPSRAVNGGWGSGYEGWVSNVGKPQTITVDLGSSKTFSRYLLRHDAAARPAETANTTKNWTLETSDNNSTWTTRDTVTNNTAATTDRTITGVTARYVRLSISEPTQGTTSDSVNNPRARIGQFELYNGTTGNPTGQFTEEQNILKGDIDTTMSLGGAPVSMRTWTGANDNLVVTRIQANAATRIRVSNTTQIQNGRSGFTSTSGTSGNTVWAARQTASGQWTSRAALATRVIGGTQSVANNQITVDIPSGGVINVVTAVAGGGTSGNDPAPAARSLADAQTSGSIDSQYNAHVEWWKQYWLKSYVDLDDDVLERYYYAAQYFIGSASRAGKTAPGLFGIWATTDYPLWGGDMHLNYNWIANFYGVYSSNRAELALPVFDLVSAYLPEARRRATQDLRRVNTGYVNGRFPSGGVPSGVLFPVGIAPNGSTADDNYHQQVGNSLFTATQYVAYWQYTRDQTWLSQRGYPFMKEVATFFQHWLQLENNRFNLYSGPHEGTWARNSGADLGMLKTLLTTAIDASTRLNVDATNRATWQDMLNRLAPIPRTTYNNQQVFALGDPGTVSDGRAIRPGDNTVNLEFIHPGEALGINGPAADRQVAIQTLDAMNSWGQENSFPKVFTQAARVGYPAQSLIDRLKNQITTRSAPNGRVVDPNHGLEKSGTVEAINSMLLQSDLGIMRVFPVWPSGKNGSFVKLRAPGGFVVSSARANGQASYVDVTSTVGGQLRLQNPWPGRGVTVTGGVTPVLSNDVITFSTAASATYSITPN